MRLQLEIALQCFAYGLETLTRRDIGFYLLGENGSVSERQLDYLLAQLTRQKLLQQHGRGLETCFRITAAGQQRCPVISPAENWERTWDSQWRVFVFDLPANRKSYRSKLWRALRNAKLGLLQNSVWIWPHEIEPLLRATITAQNIPECFCGFTVRSLFLCNDAELVATAWDFAAIAQDHQTYLQHPVAHSAALHKTNDRAALYRLARIERAAYQDAFALDPLLPRQLWPKAYKGSQVEERHRVFTKTLRARLKTVTT